MHIIDGLRTDNPNPKTPRFTPPMPLGGPSLILETNKSYNGRGGDDLGNKEAYMFFPKKISGDKIVGFSTKCYMTTIDPNGTINVDAEGSKATGFEIIA
jgi:hypothetical protein